LKTGSQDDIETNLLLLQAQTELKQFESVATNAMLLVESFPSSVYYYAGLANNQLKQYKKKDFLEMGMDYVVENRN
jgi:hypothetical protein